MKVASFSLYKDLYYSVVIVASYMTAFPTSFDLSENSSMSGEEYVCVGGNLPREGKRVDISS